jgi:hypothetical protein
VSVAASEGAVRGNRCHRIRVMHASGMTPVQIARYLGVHGKVVHNALSQERKRVADGTKRGTKRYVRVEEEPVTTVRPRIEREIAAGKRCCRCWLILPCDHQQ